MSYDKTRKVLETSGDGRWPVLGGCDWTVRVDSVHVDFTLSDCEDSTEEVSVSVDLKGGLIVDFDTIVFYASINSCNHC